MEEFNFIKTSNSLVKNPLIDKDFLLQLDEMHNKEIFAKVIALNIDELPIEQIEGRVTQGSINIDGTSTVRRTCSLTLIAKDINVNNFYWGEKTKISLQIGIKNTINDKYPKIIWFPQGIFIITTFNTSHSNSNYTISISGKDKMCLLNGDFGGSLPASIDFGKEQKVEYKYTISKITEAEYLPSKYFILKNNLYELDTNESFNPKKEYYKREEYITLTKIPIKKIITEMLLAYAGESLQNISINDLTDYGLELLEYRGENNVLYMVYNRDRGVYENIIINDDQPCYYGPNYSLNCKISELERYNLKYRSGVEPGEIPTSGTLVKLNLLSDALYEILPIKKSETAGYRITDLVYSGDLISGIGETITSILDKIVQMLGNFEYFYDIDGHFIFQEKKNYINTSWTPLSKENNDIRVENSAFIDKVTYNFKGHNLITSFQNNPQLSSVKNDYVVWGKRESVNGKQILIHLRYAIDKKPFYYKNFNNKIFISKEYSGTRKGTIVDWREIIFQMAKDFYKNNETDDFFIKVQNNNINENNESYYPGGKTGYEKYYIDLFSFWRELYNTFEEENDLINYNMDDYYFEEDKMYWNKNIDTNPESLNFWFDFLDSNGELSKYATFAIGDRIKVENNDKVSSIFFKETPNIIFISDINEYDSTDKKDGYIYCRLPQNLVNLFSISFQGLSAKTAVDNLLFNHSYCTETINFSALPVYYLQPNTLINVYDKETQINGEYFMTRITLPLSYNGIMQCTATKAVDRII